MATFVNGTKIEMTRGDTPIFDISAIIEAVQTEYNPAAGDTIYFRLKKSAWDTPLLLQKTVTNGQLQMTVDDTKSLEFGEYVYSLELVTAGGYHETFVRPRPDEGSFKIGEENENHAV